MLFYASSRRDDPSCRASRIVGGRTEKRGSWQQPTTGSPLRVHSACPPSLPDGSVHGIFLPARIDDYAEGCAFPALHLPRFVVMRCQGHMSGVSFPKHRSPTPRRKSPPAAIRPYFSGNWCVWLRRSSSWKPRCMSFGSSMTGESSSFDQSNPRSKGFNAWAGSNSRLSTGWGA